MRQDPFPSPGGDGEEPDGSVPPPDAEAGAEAGAEQGLFVCLPAEDLDVSRFAQHGQSDAMPPGPLLAGVVHVLAGEDGESLVARELPSGEVLASWQHVEQRALDLRAAGVPGTLQELRVRAYLDLLQERDSRLAPAAPGSAPGAAPHGPHDDSRPADAPTGADGSGGEPGNPGSNSGSNPGSNPGGGVGPCSGPQPGGPDAPSRTDPDVRAGQDRRPAVAALVTITLPWSTLAGHSDTPGEAAGFGLLDADTVRDLVAAAARHPHSRWCLTATAPDGTAVAHGCAAGQLPWRAGPQAARFFQALRLTLLPVIRGPCAHAQAERRYRPGRVLQHLVRARNARCTAPGCGQSAARCDLDHTNPRHHDGPTCPCNLAPLCRHHHRCKQAEGWWLEQPEPGVPVWRTPSGRAYTTTPTVYET